MFKAKNRMGWGEKKGQLLINLAGQQLCVSGKEQYPERLLAYSCSKYPVLTGKINAAFIIYLILTF